MTIKKELILHLGSTAILFALITLYRRWFDSPWYSMLWLGGVIGALMPDIDHFIATLMARPQELTSQRVNTMLQNRQFTNATELLSRTRYERSRPVFHTAFFQVLFTVFAFFVVSSTGSLFGRGIVLAFMLHLLVDQAIDLKEKGSIESWFANMPLSLDQKQISLYWAANFIALFFFAFLF